MAESQKSADVAVSMAVVEYDTENIDSPVLTVEEAIQKSSFYEVPSFFCPKQVGNFSEGMAEADHKILSAEVLSITSPVISCKRVLENLTSYEV